MVIRIPDFSGDIHTKGRIIVPCQCSYSPNGDFLTEIHKHRPKPHPTPKTSKIGIKNNTIYEPNEFSDLWKRQFNRWWGWNWQRRRKDFLRKFGIKTTQFSNKTDKSIFKEETTNKHCPIKRVTKSDDSYRLKRNNYCSKFNPERFAPLPPFYTCGLRKPYEGRRRRRKHDRREYQSWLREITSSDSDSPVKTAERCFKDRSIGQQCSYLQKRLDHLVSEDERSTSTHEKTDYNKLEFRSPISGKIYDLSQPTLVNCTPCECDNVKYLDTVSLNNESFLPKFEFDWLEKYNLMKEDHTELLTTICDIIRASHCNTGKKEVEKRPVYKRSAPNEPKSDPDCFPDIFYESQYNVDKEEFEKATNMRSALYEPNSAPEYFEFHSFPTNIYESHFKTGKTEVNVRSAPSEPKNAPEYFEFPSTDRFPKNIYESHFKTGTKEDHKAPSNIHFVPNEPKSAPDNIENIYESHFKTGTKEDHRAPSNIHFSPNEHKSAPDNIENIYELHFKTDTKDHKAPSNIHFAPNEPKSAPDNIDNIYESHFKTGTKEVHKAPSNIRFAPNEPKSDNIEILCASHFKTGNTEIDKVPSNMRSAQEPNSAPDNFTEIYCASHFKTDSIEVNKTSSLAPKTAPEHFEFPSIDRFPKNICESHCKTGFDKGPNNMRSTPREHKSVPDRFPEIICESQFITGENEVEMRSTSKEPKSAHDIFPEIICESQFKIGKKEVDMRSAPNEPKSATDRFPEIICESQFITGKKEVDMRSAPKEPNSISEIFCASHFKTGNKVDRAPGNSHSAPIEPEYYEFISSESFPEIICGSHFKTGKEEVPLEPINAPEYFECTQTKNYPLNTQNVQYFEKLENVSGKTVVCSQYFERSQNAPRNENFEPTKRDSFTTLFLYLDKNSNNRQKIVRSESYVGQIMPKVCINQPHSDSYLMRNDPILNIVNDCRQLSSCESILLANSCYEDALESDYDLNYIENHLSSFTSFISDTEFIAE